MAIFIWNDSYNTGIEIIDTQHKKLVDILNQLDGCIAIENAPASAHKLLDELFEYTQYHFTAEEEFMHSHEYDIKACQAHQQEHQQFIEQIKQIRESCHNQTDKVTDELLDFLVQWLMNHILLTDKQMATDILTPPDQENKSQTHIDILQTNLYGALRESESRFKELADILPALIWMSNAEGKRIFVNKQFLAFTGLTTTECIGNDWLNAIHQDDQDALQLAYSQVKTNHKPIKIEYRLMQNNGTEHWILETVVPRIRKNGQLAGFMGCGIDISQQKQIEKALEETVTKRTEQLQATNQILEKEKNQLKEAQGHLVQSEKMASIGQLAAGVAHEINNPLGYIYSNLNTLKNYLKDLEQISEMANKLTGQLPADNPVATEFVQLKKDLDLDFLQEDLQDLVKESIEGATRAKKIVQDLRDFSRIDKQEKEMFDLEAGLNATLNIVNNELKYKADIIKEYAGIQPFECVGAQLNQVFMNLLVNAAHSIEDFGKITVRTGYQDKEWVWVEIEDTGKGIPDNVKNKIFDPFFTTKPVGKGTGLGLSLSYKIIQDHHGKIEVDSIVGKGTKFRIYLPTNPNK